MGIEQGGLSTKARADQERAAGFLRNLISKEHRDSPAVRMLFDEARYAQATGESAAKFGSDELEHGSTEFKIEAETRFAEAAVAVDLIETGGLDQTQIPPELLAYQAYKDAES